MLRLRPYNKNDAEIIMSWIKDESAFYKWTAGVLGEYPISEEQFNTVSNLMAFTAMPISSLILYVFCIFFHSSISINPSFCDWCINPYPYNLDYNYLMVCQQLRLPVYQ